MLKRTAAGLQIPSTCRTSAPRRDNWLAPLALDEDTEQDLVLAVNEAASNAIEHAYVAPGPGDLVTVSLWTEPRHLYVEVADHCRWQRPDRDPGHRGRGILILQQVVGSASIRQGPGRHPGTAASPHRLIATTNAAGISRRPIASTRCSAPGCALRGAHPGESRGGPVRGPFVVAGRAASGSPRDPRLQVAASGGVMPEPRIP